MIVIKHVDLDKDLVAQTITLKGIMAVLGVRVPKKDNPQVTLVVNTAEHITRSVDLVLLREGQDAVSILSNPKYKGTEKGYYLFEKAIRPRPR